MAKIWKRWGIKPLKQETFKFSADPELEANIRDVVGLHLDPSENAFVLSFHEEGEFQALDRTAPILSIRSDLPEKGSHDYVRDGTTALLAALEIATGKATRTCLPRHRLGKFLRFLEQVSERPSTGPAAPDRGQLRHPQNPKVNAWLAQNSRVTMYFAPSSGSLRNVVEIFFGIITRQLIRRGAFNSVTDLIGTIARFNDSWNTDCQLFTWTKTPHATSSRPQTRGKRNLIQ